MPGGSVPTSERTAGEWRARAAGLLIIVALAAAPSVHGQCVTDQDCRDLASDFCRIYPCRNGICQPSVPRSCNDGNLCTDDSCDVICRNVPHCRDDGAICNGPERCEIITLRFPPPSTGTFDLPICVSGPPLACDDGDACTIDSCVEPAGCSHVSLNCNDGNPCTADGCDRATGCANMPVAGCCRSNEDCQSGACTVDRTCVSGTCTAGRPRDCDDGDPCTADACEPATGCLNQPVAGCCRDDADCPAAPCFTQACVANACVVGTPRVCDDGDPCTTDDCDAATGCRSTPRAGLEALTCVCARALPASCDGQDLPGRLTKRLARACVLIERAGAGASAGKLRKLIGRAAKQLGKANELAARITKRSRIDAACGAALVTALADQQTRAQTARDQL